MRLSSLATKLLNAVDTYYAPAPGKEKDAREKLATIVEEIVKAYGGGCDLCFGKGYSGLDYAEKEGVGFAKIEYCTCKRGEILEKWFFKPNESKNT